MTDHSNLTTIIAKKALRARAVARRRLAYAGKGAAAAERVAELAAALEVAAGTVVAGYWPMGDELDSGPVMRHLLDRGCRLALPMVAARGQALSFRAWAPGDVLEPGLHGTNHPAAHAAALVPALLLVPLLAFDRQCFRLGYGGGYYDRTLESLRRDAQVKAIGLAFAAQEVAVVPRDGHDQRLDMVLTEGGLIIPELQ